MNYRKRKMIKSHYPRNVLRPLMLLMKGSRSKRKIADDDDDSDVYLPDARGNEPDDEEDIGSLSAEESHSPMISEETSPEPIVRKSKSKLNKFTASTPASSSPSTNYSTPKPALGAFGKALDKGERVKNFNEKNKDRYSWLLDIRDKEGNRPSDENYDPRTLFIPSSAWKSFTAFEKQYWYYYYWWN
jgi:DNA mismatch repair protein MSH6